jgi:hypothetical protein
MEVPRALPAGLHFPKNSKDIFWRWWKRFEFIDRINSRDPPPVRKVILKVESMRLGHTLTQMTRRYAQYSVEKR